MTVMLEENHEPYVPTEALQRPAGAAVTDGSVSCVGCGGRIPVAKADVVGLGYRCAPCSHRAELALLTGGGDAASHFTANERRGLCASGMNLIWIGIGGLTLGALLVLIRPGIGLATMVAGGATIGLGLARRNAAH